ncbi:hypothetical protein N0V90_004248 [Kalmusia sp. IMI 367209]|nr:hypothetical protein N0V90_004248 [Kalmusia sp. IMI 367209]
MQAVREFFAGLTQSEALRYCLGLQDFHNAPPLARHAVVICFDTEGWNPDSRKLTEVGFNGFHSNDMRSTEAGPWGEHFLRKVHFYHARIAENSHLKNKSGTMGDPEKNRFGKTRFLSCFEARVALEEFFAPRTADGRGICPVIVLGHALGGDTEKLQKLLTFSTNRLGNVVKACDTQAMVRELGFWSDRNQVGLQRLIFELGFEYRDAHTASNDAAMTMIAAILLVLESNGHSEKKELQDVIDGVEAASQYHEWFHGSDKYCTRCHSPGHNVKNRGDGQPCKKYVRCEHCREAGRHEAQHGHDTSDCISFALANGNSKTAAKKKKAEREAMAEKARLEGRNISEVIRDRRGSYTRRGTSYTVSAALALPLHEHRSRPKKDSVISTANGADAKSSGGSSSSSQAPRHIDYRHSPDGTTTSLGSPLRVLAPAVAITSKRPSRSQSSGNATQSGGLNFASTNIFATIGSDDVDKNSEDSDNDKPQTL